MARLVYDDGIPVKKIVKSETLQKILKQLNFSKVTKHSIIRQLENEYQALFQIVKSIIAGRDPLTFFACHLINGQHRTV